MALEVRPVKDVAEFTEGVLAIGQYFGMVANEERMQRFADQMTLERMHAAWSDGTVAGVLPTHRRRGILRALMRAQLDDAHERGEPLAALWASEETIYGRFGYGLASFCGEIALAHEHNSFAQPFEPQGTLRLIDADEALEAIPPVFEEIRPEWPGMFSRSRLWWENREIADPEERRDGAGPKRWVAYERDGSLEGYAVYRHRPGFEAGTTNAELRVLEALGTTPEALRDIWAYLLAIDWIATTKSFLLPPEHALFMLLATPRRARYRMGDGLWVRLLDVGAALSGRVYQGDEPIVFEVADEFCPWNEGRWKLEGGRAERTKDEPDLRLPVQSLGSALLGGVSFATLRRAGRLAEVKDGAIARGDSLFRWDRHPWCPEIF